VNVSCMMVTKPGRETLARLAIADFYRQTHPYRDLVVVTTSVDSFRALAQVLPCDGTSLLGLADVAPLGALRNVALDHAKGPIICQWDDDDRYHPQRIEEQLWGLTAFHRHSCFLTSQLYYYRDNNPPFLHVVDWTLAPTAGSGILIPGTLLCEKSEVRYEDALRSGEDTRFLQAEIKAHGPAATIDRPGLYARGWHYTRGAQNTTDHATAMINVRDRGWRRKKITERLDELKSDIRALKLPHEIIQLRVARANVHLSLAGDTGPMVALQ
jgi:glycosyltransferase involved in cell wall biosynthesis